MSDKKQLAELKTLLNEVVGQEVDRKFNEENGRTAAHESFTRTKKPAYFPFDTGDTTLVDRIQYDGKELLIGKALQACYKAQKGDAKAQAELAKLTLKEMSEDTSTEGGNFLDDDYLADVLAIQDVGNLEKYCRGFRMKSKVCNVPSLTTAPSVSWSVESADLVESTPVVGTVEITAERVGAWLTVTNELLEDSEINTISWLDQLFATALGMEIDNQILNGDGSDTCSGILTGNVGNSVVMGAGSVNVSFTNGDHLSDMVAQINAQQLPSCRWVMHPAAFNVIRKLKDDNGQYLYSPISGSENKIFGYPVTLCASAPSAPSTGENFIVFGNFKNVLLGKRKSASLEMDSYGLFTTNRTRCRILRRIGIEIGLPDGFSVLQTAGA